MLSRFAFRWASVLSKLAAVMVGEGLAGVRRGSSYDYCSRLGRYSPQYKVRLYFPFGDSTQ